MAEYRPTLIPADLPPELAPSDPEVRDRWLEAVEAELERLDRRAAESARRRAPHRWWRRWWRGVVHNAIVHPLIPLAELVDRLVGARWLVELVELWHTRSYDRWAPPHDD